MKRRGLIVSLVAIVTVAVGGVILTLVTDTKPQLGLDLQGGASVTLQPVGEADTSRSRSSPTSCATASTASVWPSRRSSGKGRRSS